MYQSASTTLYCTIFIVFIKIIKLSFLIFYRINCKIKLLLYTFYLLNFLSKMDLSTLQLFCYSIKKNN